MRRSLTLIVGGPAVCTLAILAYQAQPWQLGPFSRRVTTPVIAPNRESLFRDPVSGRSVNWEALHTFNPAAIVRNGKVYILYRAEDDTGEMQIGLHTSRLGLAESPDGIHFSRRPQPVLYPDNDAQKDREWPGGCDDSRIVESEDGTYVLTYTQWNLRRAATPSISNGKSLVPNRERRGGMTPVF